MSRPLALIDESSRGHDGHGRFSDQAQVSTHFTGAKTAHANEVLMGSFRFVNIVLLTSFAASIAACSDESPATPGAGGAGGGGTVTTGTTTTGSTTTTGAGGATGSTTTTTGTTGTGGSTDVPSALPFVVDSLFVASGYEGDGSSPGAIAQDDNMACAASRPTGAVGHCHKFTYTPGAIGWGGVIWQYPVNNWGTMAGKRIASGATKITFTASGAAGGESVKFLAGGIGMAGTGFVDTVNASLGPIVLTTTPTPYIIDLTGQTYDAVIGGFGWVIEAPVGSTAPIAFTVDNIRWEQ
jgi:hypothetical protein